MRSVHSADRDDTVEAPNAAAARTERSLLFAFVSMRAAQLAAASVSLWLDRHRYRRPRLAAITWCITVVESIWLTRRGHTRGGHNDPTVAIVDTAVGCAAIVALAAALPADEQFGASNWMFPITLLSAVGASAGFALPWQSAGAGAALMATYTLTTAHRAPGKIGQSLFGAFQYAGCFAGGSILVRRSRITAALIQQIERDAVHQAETLAVEQERTRLQSELHLGALRALDAVRTHWPADRAQAHAVARREATRLRDKLANDGTSPTGFAREIAHVAAELAESGLGVELVLEDLDWTPTDAQRLALTESLRASLRNVRTHAGVRRAVVRATETGTELTVTIRDQGRGSAQTIPPTSVSRPLNAVDGTVDWWTRPGRGARVTLRVPK